jgi:cytochrome c-type biogenesis protein CcmH/NrfG
MTFAVLLGALCTLIAAALVAPFLGAGRRASTFPLADRTESARPLLRRLRDLDDDLASGRVREADHLRLRGDLERQAADALRDESLPVRRHRPIAARNPGREAATPARSRWIRLGAGIAVAALAAAGTPALLRGAVDQRPSQTPAIGGPAAATGDAPSRDALAEVEAAVQKVKRHPGQAAAHVELARAYTAVGQPQLAAVEYLAATRLDPTDAEANTALAMVAYQAGSVRRADALLSRTLHEHPGYPEALYTRGLVRAMGLHQPTAAARDLKAYRRAAPHGVHRTTVSTVLALLDAEAIK